jgi:endoglucanase
VGDCATFQPNYTEFGDGLICSKAIDDRFGCAIMVDMINRELEYDTYFAFNVCEEVGCDGAKAVVHYLRPDIVFAIESTTAGDVFGVPTSKSACKLGDGAVLSIMDRSTIYDKELLNIAIEIADKENIKWQYKNVVSGGNEAGVYQRGAGATKVLAISAPTRYIHSASNVVSLADIESVSALCKALNRRSFDL